MKLTRLLVVLTYFVLSLFAPTASAICLVNSSAFYSIAPPEEFSIPENDLLSAWYVAQGEFGTSSLMLALGDPLLEAALVTHSEAEALRSPDARANFLADDLQTLSKPDGIVAMCSTWAHKSQLGSTFSVTVRYLGFEQDVTPSYTAARTYAYISPADVDAALQPAGVSRATYQPNDAPKPKLRSLFGESRYAFLIKRNASDAQIAADPELPSQSHTASVTQYRRGDIPPEPATSWMLVPGLFGFLAVRMRRHFFGKPA